MSRARIKRAYFAGFLLAAFYLFSPHTLYSKDKPASFEILYVANLNGILENCRCGTPSLGGLDRLATLIQKKRTENPQCLFIDGGDFFNPYPYKILNRYISEIYSLLKPDLMVPGDQEFVEGSLFFSKQLSQLKTRLLSTNLSIEEIEIARNREPWPGIHILSYLDKSSFMFHGVPKGVTLDEGRFASQLRQIPASEYIIVLFHGEESALQKWMNTYNRIDLVLTGHTQNLKSDLNNHPGIIGGGMDGEYLIDLHFVKNDSTYNITYDKIPVSLDIPPRTDIEQHTKKFKQIVEKNE